MSEEETEEEPFFEQLTRFIQANKEFLLEIFGKWTKQSSRQFYEDWSCFHSRNCQWCSHWLWKD